jgi:hypothetical protein
MVGLANQPAPSGGPREAWRLARPLGARLGLGLGWLAACSLPCSHLVGRVARPCHPDNLKVALAGYFILIKKLNIILHIIFVMDKSIKPCRLLSMFFGCWVPHWGSWANCSPRPNHPSVAKVWCPDHTKLSVQLQLWNCWGLCSEIDVGPPLFTLFQPEMSTDGARSGRCDQPPRVGLCMVTTLLSLTIPILVGANIALPVEQCDATGCTINHASATWPERNSCRVHDSICAQTYFFTSLIERQIKHLSMDIEGRADTSTLLKSHIDH